MSCSRKQLKESDMTSTLDSAWDAFEDLEHKSFQQSWNSGIAQQDNPDTAWDEFCSNEIVASVAADMASEILDKQKELLEAPECSPIYVSTKTKIAYLNSQIPLEEMFWAIPVLKSYALQQEGIVKKEMKFKTVSKEALEALIKRVDSVEPGPLVQQNVKNHVEGGGSNVKFKDIRKVSIGMCKKQMVSFRSKAKGAFFNCFAVILRLRWEGVFREMHIKVFNTGKLEIPGIPGVNTDQFLECVLSTLIRFVRPISDKLGLKRPLDYKPNCSETVLTNSNFTANYLIDREKLCSTLRKKYRVLSTYDPCSYPGVQSKFYYVEGRETQDGRPLTEQEQAGPKKHIIVPFMVFRTGSVLIVGKFDDDVLQCVYGFASSVLKDEFHSIQVGMPENKEENIPRKVKKRFIMINSTT
jgi:hypothetical protein